MTDGEQDEAADGGDGGEHDGQDNEANEDATAASSSACPWVAYEDDEGREYYYNQETGETQWERPDDMPPAETATAGDADRGDVDADGDGSGVVSKDELLSTEETKGEEEGHSAVDDVAEGRSKAGGEVEDDVEEEKGADGRRKDDGTADADADAAAGDAETAGEDAPTEGEAGASPWVAYTDDQGREYFYNQETGETQWERPDDMPAPAPSSPKEGEDVVGREVAGEGDAEVEPAVTEDADMKEATAVEEEPEQEEKEEEEEDAVSKALSALKETDAILEPDCLSHLSELVTSLGGNVGGPKAIKNLVAGYHGQTAICGLMAAWLTDLLASTEEGAGGADSGGSNKTSAMGVLPPTAASAGMKDPRETAADATRLIAENVVKGIATEKFTKTGGDNILRLSKSEAAFLEDIFDSDRFRHLLIDLSARHKDSALLMYCLQSISKRGHHREIAKRINQSDYFGVFSAMLSSELSIIGKMAVGANSDDASVPNNGADAASDIGKDLLRTCTSTSYTFLYATEALEDLVRRAESKKGGSEILRRAIRKWEKLKEDLEEAMLSQAEGSSPLAKKRRIDVTLTSSELQQRQRRKLEPGRAPVISAKDSTSDGVNSSDPLRSSVASDVLSLLRKSAVGMPIDASLAERLAKASSVGSTQGNGIEEDVGALLVAHPTSIVALLAKLFRSGSSRVQASEANQKYARLIARSVLASRRLAFATNGDVSGANIEEQGEEEDGIIKDLLCGSDLCEQVSNMVSFTVLDDKSAGESASVGRRLSALTIKSAPVAQGVLLWATELASGGEFLASAAYPTLAPGVLSLARIIATHHPFTRNAVLDLTYLFLGHSNPDLSFQKAQALKEQSLRLLMWLSTQGMALSVFSTISNKLKKGSAGIDSSLVRYFLGGCLDIIRPPFSVSFVRSMGTMLLTKPSIEALRSTYFPTEKKNALKQLIKNFKDELEHDSCSGFVTQDDRNLVSTLFALYGETQ